MIDLSIIIPYYNTKEFTNELLSVLAKQMRENVEVILVDDGSKEAFDHEAKFLQIIRLDDDCGVSVARNTGIERAKGRYIAFIDSDDLVSENYIEKVLEAIETNPECVYISWKTIGKGWDFACDLSKMDFPPWNLCVWNRIWRRDVIGDKRFNVKKRAAEDADFIHQIKISDVRKVKEFLYFYRTGHDSLSSQYQNGETDFDRIVFHYPSITKDMTWLLEEVKKVNEEGEAIVLTNHNEIKELENYAMVMKPRAITGTKLVGTPWREFKLIPKPIRTQVVIYIAKTSKIGGVETWIYNFVSQMCDLYDIIVAYSEEMSGEQIVRLSEKVQVVKILNRAIVCDTLLNMRITDQIPDKIKAKQIIQVCHTCKMKDWKIQKKYDKLVYVSETASKTFEEDGEVILNMTSEKPKKSLLLVTASRFTFEKGLQRMLKLAEALRKAEIPFLWLVFTNADVKLTDGMVKAPPSIDVRAYIQKADYLVQLSDVEAFCYSLVEAMELGVPVITTKLGVLSEIGFEEGKTGFALPMDMSEIPVEAIYKGLKKFKYSWDNEAIKQKWIELLGKSEPKGDYQRQGALVKVQVIEEYGDLVLGRNVHVGEEITMPRDRARIIVLSGKAVIL